MIRGRSKHMNSRKLGLRVICMLTKSIDFHRVTKRHQIDNLQHGSLAYVAGGCDCRADGATRPLLTERRHSVKPAGMNCLP